MRTNIVLDDELVKRAQELTGIRTKKELVHEALRTLIRLREQEKARDLRGKLHWEGDLKAMGEERAPYEDQEATVRLRVDDLRRLEFWLDNLLHREPEPEDEIVAEYAEVLLKNVERGDTELRAWEDLERELRGDLSGSDD